MRATVPLLLAAAVLSAGPSPGLEKPRKSKGSGPVRSAAEAKAIAERETGGVAVSARRTSLNGAS